MRSYSSFCTWLCERVEGSRMAFLPFAGRNRVIYRTASATPARVSVHLQVVSHVKPAAAWCSPMARLWAGTEECTQKERGVPGVVFRVAIL